MDSKNNISTAKSTNKIELKELSREINQISQEVQMASVIAINTAEEAIADFQKREWNRTESSRAGFRILNILTAFGGYMRFTDISKKVLRSKCAVSRVINSLEKSGLVRREQVSEDRREKRISITEKGIDCLNATMHQRHQIGNQIMSCLDEEEMEQLIKLLRKITKHIQENFPVRNKSKKNEEMD